MTLLNVGNLNLTGNDIESAEALDDGDYTQSSMYLVNLTDEGFDNHGVYSVTVGREEVSPSDLETILDIIEPT